MAASSSRNRKSVSITTRQPAGVLTVDGAIARTTIQTRSEGDYFIALSSHGGYGDREGHYIDCA